MQLAAWLLNWVPELGGYTLRSYILLHDTLLLSQCCCYESRRDEHTLLAMMIFTHTHGNQLAILNCKNCPTRVARAWRSVATHMAKAIQLSGHNASKAHRDVATMALQDSDMYPEDLCVTPLELI